MKKSILIFISFLFVSQFLFAVDKLSKYHVEPAKCVGCKICVSKCPTKAITMVKGKAVIDPKKCVNCGLCAKACPTKAIHPPVKKK